MSLGFWKHFDTFLITLSRLRVFQVNTRFLLYSSRRSRRDTPLLDVAFTNMTSIWHWAGKAFNVSAPTKVIVHGFGSSCSNVWVYEMRSALMDVVSTTLQHPTTVVDNKSAGSYYNNYYYLSRYLIFIDPLRRLLFSKMCHVAIDLH